MASSWSSVFTLGNIAIGVGCLSFPYVYRLCGVLGGMSLSAVVSLIMVFTLNSLVSSAHFYKASSYQGLVEVALGGPLGKMASTVMGMTICFYIFGALIGYLMVVGDVIPPFVGLVVGAESFWAQRWVVITLVGTLVSFPISCVHNLSALTSISGLSVFSLGYTALMVIVSAGRRLALYPDLWEKVDWGVRMETNPLSAVPIVVYALQCQMIIINVYSELESKPSLTRVFTSRLQWLHRLTAPTAPESIPEGEEDSSDADEERAQDASRSSLQAPLLHRTFSGDDSTRITGMMWIVGVATFVLWVGYTLIALSGYLAYNDDVQTDILTNFPTDFIPLQVARVIMGLNSGCCSFPVNVFPMRQALTLLVGKVFPKAVDGHPLLMHYTLTVLIFVSALAVALSISELGDVFNVVGGTAGSVIVFIAPCTIWILQHVKMSRSSSENALSYLAPATVRRGFVSKARPVMTASLVVSTLALGVALLVNTVYSHVAVKPFDPPIVPGGVNPDDVSALVAMSPFW